MSEIAPSRAGSDVADTKLRCPICGSSEFQDYHGRPNARCATCRTVERTRLLWMILEKKGLFRRGLRVMHIAPERPIAKRFFELSGNYYYACDIDPGRYADRSAVVRPIDLCCDLVKLPSRAFDLIIHTHVLEHLRCDPEAVLLELERILAPGGHHFFAVPVSGKETREDLSDDLTPAQREEMFLQADHYRVFGSQSLPDMLDRVWGKREKHHIEPLELFDADALQTAAIPKRGWTGISGVAIFHHERPLSEPVTSQRKTSMPAKVESAGSGVDQQQANPLVEFKPAAGNLILHIGMASAGAISLQRWLAKNRVAALNAGLDYWSIAQNHSQAMSQAFADAQPDSKSARQSLDRFLDGLTEHTGFISAEQLWNLASAEVKILAGYFHSRGVRPLVLCWIRQPAEQLTQAALRKCESTFTPDDFGFGFEEKNKLRYKRVGTWVEHFGPDRVIATPFHGSAVHQIQSLLQTLGIRFDSANPIERPPGPALSLTEVKAFLALNQVQKSGGAATLAPRLRKILHGIDGADFHLPDSLLQSMSAEFEKDTRYLANQFAMDREWLVSGGIGVDDAAFFQWNRDEITALLRAINEVLLQRDAENAPSTDEGTP